MEARGITAGQLTEGTTKSTLDELADWVETGEPGADGSYQVEGIGSSNIPGNLDGGVIDAAERIRDEESFDMARRLVREEGLLVGGSSGTNVVAAMLPYLREHFGYP